MSRREAAGILALAEVTPGPSSRVADLVEAAGGTSRLVAARPGADDAAERWAAELDRLLADDADVGVVTVLDDDYPANLARVFNRPPLLFVRGRLDPDDVRSVAIVGTRRPSEQARTAAAGLARALAAGGVTVVSGLARGVDTEAHAAALDAGGRTIGVLGSGIRRIYPPENTDLARRMAHSGAVVSHFWPDAAPTPASFPLRNVVTSGLALGTLVVEAAADSGARMQAGLAHEHGRPVFLLDALVRSEGWASELAERGGATVVGDADDLVPALDRLLRDRHAATNAERARVDSRRARAPGPGEQLRLL